jgi:hypothetical protein
MESIMSLIFETNETLAPLQDGFIRIACGINPELTIKLHNRVAFSYLQEGAMSGRDKVLPLVSKSGKTLVAGVQYAGRQACGGVAETIDLPIWLGKTMGLCDRYGHLLDRRGNRLASGSRSSQKWRSIEDNTNIPF